MAEGVADVEDGVSVVLVLVLLPLLLDDGAWLEELEEAVEVTTIELLLEDGLVLDALEAPVEVLNTELLPLLPVLPKSAAPPHTLSHVDPKPVDTDVIEE